MTILLGMKTTEQDIDDLTERIDADRAVLKSLFNHLDSRDRLVRAHLVAANESLHLAQDALQEAKGFFGLRPKQSVEIEAGKTWSGPSHPED